jgi:hypothetical protein
MSELERVLVLFVAAVILAGAARRAGAITCRPRLSIRPILESFDPAERRQYLMVAAATVVTVVVVRMVEMTARRAQ